MVPLIQVLILFENESFFLIKQFFKYLYKSIKLILPKLESVLSKNPFLLEAQTL